MMPRIRNRWDHFSRVEGGIGMRGGEGEKQLELDRRMIDNQINIVKSRLKKVDVQINNDRTILLSDTIGFINKLPHSLVASFKSTLEEILKSKLILHVIDSSSHNVAGNIECVNETLREIGA